MAQLAGPVELLKGSWEILQARWKTFFVIQLVPIAVLIPVGILLAVLAIVFGLRPIMSGGGLPDIPSIATSVAGIVVGLLVIALFFGMILIQLWAGVAMIFAIRDWKEGIGFKESYRRAWKVLRSYFWVALLTGLAILGGMILLIIPGLIFMVWFGFAGYVVIDQGIKGVGALKASKTLVNGRFWAVVGRLSAIGILGIVLSIVGDLASAVWEDTPMVWVGVLGTMVVSLLWTPFAGVYMYLLYASLKSSTTNESE